MILVSSVIRHWKLLTSSRSSRIFPSALPGLSLSIFKSSAMTTVCLNKQLPTTKQQLPTTRNNIQQRVQTLSIQQYWELLANNVASVCTGLKLSAKSLNGYVLLNKVWFSQGIQFRYLASWTECLFSPGKPLKGCEGWLYWGLHFNTKLSFFFQKKKTNSMMAVQKLLLLYIRNEMIRGLT